MNRIILILILFLSSCRTAIKTTDQFTVVEEKNNVVDSSTEKTETVTITKENSLLEEVLFEFEFDTSGRTPVDAKDYVPVDMIKIDSSGNVTVMDNVVKLKISKKTKASSKDSLGVTVVDSSGKKKIDTEKTTIESNKTKTKRNGLVSALVVPGILISLAIIIFFYIRRRKKKN